MNYVCTGRFRLRCIAKESVEISGTYDYIVNEALSSEQFTIIIVNDGGNVDVGYLSRDKSIRFDADGDTLSVVPGSVSSPNGVVIVDQYGVFEFTPDPNFHGATQIDYTISDGDDEIDVAKFVTVIAINDAPTINLSKINTEYPNSTAATVAEANVAAGFERFFSLSDFGYSDTEAAPIHSITIQIPETEVGQLMLAPTGFEIDDADDLSKSPDSELIDGVRVIEVFREQIESGKLAFVANPAAVGRNAELEFNVSDGELESTTPGLFVISVQGAPKSLDESIKDAQFTRSFEALIGEGRFKSIDIALSAEGVTRDEALKEIKGLQEKRDENNLSKIYDLDEWDYRFEVKWLSHTNTSGEIKDISELTIENDDGDTVPMTNFLNDIDQLTSLTDDNLANAIATKFSTLDNPPTSRLFIAELIASLVCAAFKTRF